LQKTLDDDDDDDESDWTDSGEGSESDDAPEDYTNMASYFLKDK